MRTLQKQILVNFMKILFCNKQLYRLKSFSSPAQTIKSLPNCTIKFNKNKLRNNLSDPPKLLRCQNCMGFVRCVRAPLR